MGDQMAPGDQMVDQIFDITKMWKSGRPIWLPGAIWSSNEACYSSDLFKRSWYLPKSQQLHSESILLSGSFIKIWSAIWSPRSDLVTAVIWSAIWSPGAIWSPIRSPEHLVVDLVVVNAFSLGKRRPCLYARAKSHYLKAERKNKMHWWPDLRTKIQCLQSGSGYI